MHSCHYWIAVDHKHTEDDPGQTIYVLKHLFQQSIAELFSVDNLSNVVHHKEMSHQFHALASKGECDATRQTGKLNCNFPEEWYKTVIN